jgi:hypothetical protein
MALTDVPKQISLTDVFPEGTPFVVKNAWVEGVVPTTYGNRTMGKVLAEPVGAPAGSEQEFAVWGSMCEQVQGVDPAEFPLTVTVVKDGKRFLFKAVDEATSAAYQQAAQAPATPSAEEAALGVTPQAQDVGQVQAPAAQTAMGEAPAPVPPAAPPAAPINGGTPRS